jgi:hypothetical protein
VTHARWQWLWLLPIAIGACGKPEVKTVGNRDAGSPARLDAGPQDAGPGDAGDVDAGVDAGAPECNFTVLYGLHFPCNRDADCTSGHCAFDINNQGLPGLCTTRCSNIGTPGDCTTGFHCDFAGDDQSFSEFCLADTGTALPPNDQSLAFGSPCRQGTDCAGDGTICGSIPNGFKAYTFCSPPCDKGGMNLCHGCGKCDSYFSGRGTSCLPQGAGHIGDACGTRNDCASFVCAEFCTQVCGQGQPPCPDNGLCVATGPTQSICINPAQRGATKDHQHCLFDFQCPTSDKCLPDSQGNPVCLPIDLYGQACQGSQYCTNGLDCRPLDATSAVCSKDCGGGCGAGSACVSPQIDTVLNLYTQPTQDLTQPTATNDNGPNGTRWSELSFTAQPGTYFISVTSNNAYVNGGFEQYSGGYTLEILDGVNMPVADVELPETPTNNDTLANAQTLAQVPVRLTGMLETRASGVPADVDIYAFTLKTAATLTFRTSAGEPSACVPSGRAVGDPCATPLSCTSQLCDSSFHACTQLCTADADCGAGQRCVPATNGQMLCVAPRQYQQTAAGSACQFDWQCANSNLCVQYGAHQLCAPACAESASKCDPTKTECASVSTADAQGQLQTTQACVPLGDRTGGFLGACTLQSDCAAGMLCESGHCNKSCQATADCPNQSLSPAPGSNDVTCRPCQTDADCGAGFCLQGNGNERFCGDSCDATGVCPAGFGCTYSASFSGKACLPSEGSCHAPTCQMSQCIVPPSGYAEGCTSNADCTTSTCVGDLCTRSCQTDADCGCPSGDLVCHAAQCQPAASNIDEEIAPNSQLRNDTYVSAQALTGAAPWTVYGQLFAAPPATDQDFYSLSLTQGTTVTITARPVCGIGAPGLRSELELLDATGNALGVSTPFNGYPQIMALKVPTTGTYFVEMRPGGASSGRPDAYILSISVGH